MKHPMICVHAFSIERRGKVLASAEPGEKIDLAKLPSDARKRLCAGGIVAAGPVSPVELPAGEQPHQHVLPSAAELGEMILTPEQQAAVLAREDEAA